MSVVVEAVEDVFDAVGDVVEWAVDEIIEPVVDTVGNVVQGMLDDPIATIAKVAAIATQQYWALPLIEGANVAAKGGDLGDVLEATAKAYVAQELGSAAGRYAYEGASGAAAGAAYGTSGQQAALLAAQEAGLRTAADIAGQVIGAGAASTAAGLVYGRDPIEALKTGLVSAGSSQLVGMTLGAIDQQTGGAFAKLQSTNPTVAAVIESAVTAQVTGQNLTEAALAAAIRTSSFATKLVDQFTQDNKDITPQQKAIAAQIITNVTATAFAGGDPSRALQATLMQVGSKALGDVTTAAFKDTVNKVQEAYKNAQIRAETIDKNISEQERTAAEYNKIGGELNAKVAEQDRLRNLANEAKARFDANQNSETQAEAQNAIKTYNDYAEALAKEYTDKYKPQLDKFNNQLSSLQTEYEGLAVEYEKGLKEIRNATEPLQTKYDELFSTTSRAFVQAMDPNFNADEYRKINNLNTEVDVYEHWLSEGQFKGLKTNEKDVKVSQAIDNYTQAFGEPPPEHVLGKLVDPTNANRDKATEQYVNANIKDAQQQDIYREGVRNRLIDSYRSEGLSDAQINQKIASGEIDNLTNQIVQDVRTDLGARKEYVNQVAEKYGTDSAEYKKAYKETLNAMAEAGGYGVVKDGNDFIIPGAGKLNSETLEIQDSWVASGRSWEDPVTGRLHIEIRGPFGSEETPEKNYSALFALGQSAKPPSQGGQSVFGDGSGASPGLFGGLTLLSRDAGTGGTLYGGDNGFALIAYADGRGAVINTKTNEVIWMTPEKTKEVLDKTPVAEPVKPTQPKPDLPEPPKPSEVKPVDKATEEIKAKIQSPDEVRKAMETLGYKNPTNEEVLRFAGEKPADKLLEELKPYVDPRVVTDEEAKKAYEDLGIKNPTQEDIDKIKGQYAQTELPGKAQANLEAARYNSLLQQIQQSQGGGPLSPEAKAKFDALTEGQKTLAGQLAQQGIDFNKAIDAAREGITAETQAKFNELDAGQKALAGELTKQGVDLGKAIDTVKADITKEVAEKFGTLTTEQKALAGQLAQQGVDLKGAIDQAKTQTTQQITGVETRLSDAIKAAEAAGLTRDQAISEAVNKVSQDLGTTKEGLLAQLGKTEAGLRQEFAAGISGLEAQTQAQYASLSAGQKQLADQLVQQGVDLGTAIDRARTEFGTQIAGVSADLQAKYNTLSAGQQDLARQLTAQGVDLNTAIERAKAEFGTQIAGVSQDLQTKYNSLTANQKQLADQLAKQGVDLGTAIETARAGLSQQISGVSADLQTKYNSLSAGQKTLADQLAQQGVDLGTAIDTARAGLAGDIAGVRGDITGIRGLLEQQEAAAVARAAQQQTQAQQLALQTQQKGNVNTLMQMLGAAPDIAGQQVTVKAPDPAQIGYVYDWSSIFANPQQANMFVTPYAQGGVVGDKDDVTEELLRILRS